MSDKFRVTIGRISYGFHEVVVEAEDFAEARLKALDDAGNHEYPESSSQYRADLVEKLPERPVR